MIHQPFFGFAEPWQALSKTSAFSCCRRSYAFIHRADRMSQSHTTTSNLIACITSFHQLMVQLNHENIKLSSKKTTVQQQPCFMLPSNTILHTLKPTTPEAPKAPWRPRKMGCVLHASSFSSPLLEGLVLEWRAPAEPSGKIQ